jgi:hypothetical protein
MPSHKAIPMTEIDIADDEALRFIQRVLESDAPREDRDRAAQMVRDIRTRVRKAYAASGVAIPAPMPDCDVCGRPVHNDQPRHAVCARGVGTKPGEPA